LNIHSLKASTTKKGIRYVERLLQERQFDIFVVTETWLHDNINLNCVRIEGYRLLNVNRPVGTRGGGVAIYVRNGIDIDPEETEKSVILTANDIIGYEYLRIKLIAPTQLGVSGAYIPKTSEDAMTTFFNNMMPFFQRMTATVTLGDFNMPANTKQQFIADIEGNFNLKQLVDSPTFKRNRNILDHIYVSKTPNYFQVVSSGVIKDPNNPSDHHIIFCILSFPPHQN